MNQDNPVVESPLQIESTQEEKAARFVLSPEQIPDWTDVEIWDGKPVESFFAERQYRLLTEPLYSSWPGPSDGRPFLATANVGLFYKMKAPPLVPDAMLSLGVRLAPDFSARKETNTYAIWEFGKPPDAAIEIVSDQRGREAGLKMKQYAEIGVPYYVIFDPRRVLGGAELQTFVREGSDYRLRTDDWMPDINLGLAIWEGTFEGLTERWVRWCDQAGQLIPTGKERADKECARAEQEKQRAELEKQHRERLEAQLKAAGISPLP